MFRKTLFVFALSFAAVPVLAQPHDPIQHLLANFTRVDANGDGVISRFEFLNVVAARWAQIDHNGDGYLTEEDFPPWAAPRARMRLAEIAYLDEDGDDRISKSEFLNGPASVFTEADQNADGVLTRAEIDVPSS